MIRPTIFLRLLLVFFIVVCAVAEGKAQSPAAPVLAPLGVASVKRGAAVDLMLTGTNLAGPTGLLLGTPAKITISSEGKNGQDNAKLQVRVEVPADAPLGAYPLRLATKRGLSNVRLFCVDDLPAVAEAGSNRKTSPQALTFPCVVTGQTDAEQADCFQISAAAGQSVSFDLLGRRLGSNLDAQLIVSNAKTGREIAYDNDSPGSQGDPRLRVTFKEAGSYLVEVKDVLNRGGPEFFYRLRIGDFPLATTPVPMAARRGTKVKVEFAGPSVEGTPPVEVAVPADPNIGALLVAPKGPTGLYGWPVALSMSAHEELVEQEPNNEPAKANRVPVPGGITGRLLPGDDTDCFVFTAKKGQKLILEARTLELGSPSLVYFVVKNAKSGAEVAKSNPQTPPPGDQRLDFTPPDDGDFVVELQHLNFAGGPGETYHFTLRPAASEFALSVAADRFELSGNSPAVIPVQVKRGGYAGPIELRLSGPPHLSAAATLKAGQTAGILVVPPQEGPLGPAFAVITGKAVIDGKEVSVLASTRAATGASLNNLPFPPLHLLDTVVMSVGAKAPFTLALKLTPPDPVPGLPATVTVAVTRSPGFAEEIALNAPTGLPATVPAPKVPAIPKDKTEVSFALDFAKTPPGAYHLVVSGKNKELGAQALLLLPLGSPFELKVEPATLALAPGAKGKLKITALRRGGYKGPITVELRKLPATLTAAKATIPPDAGMVEIDVAALPTAMPVEVKDADVLGTATALNNLQAATPLIVVVQKK